LLPPWALMRAFMKRLRAVGSSMAGREVILEPRRPLSKERQMPANT
jgi:hypothetical protein